MSWLTTSPSRRRCTNVSRGCDGRLTTAATISKVSTPSPRNASRTSGAPDTATSAARRRVLYRPISARRPASQRATRRPWSTPWMSEVRKCTPSLDASVDDVMEATALTDRNALRAYLSGQDIVLAVIGIPLLTVLTFGLGAAVGSPDYGFETMPVGLAALGAALALSNIITVNGAYPGQRVGAPIDIFERGDGSSRVAAAIGTLSASRSWLSR